MRNNNGGGGSNNNNNHGGRTMLGSQREELVPLKGGPVEDIPRSGRRYRRRSAKERWTSLGAIAASGVALVLCGWALFSVAIRGGGRGGGAGQRGPDGGSSNAIGDDDGVGGGWLPPESSAFPQATPVGVVGNPAGISKLYDSIGRYIIEDYDARPPFSDFLPALAGYYGKPLYAFYVNRGQGIASFGVKTKETPMMTFHPADQSYQNVAQIGFRTFLQGSRRGKEFLTEPFSPLSTNYPQLRDEPGNRPKRWQYIGSNEMQVREVDSENRIETNVTFFVLPEETFGAFVKRTTITNIDKDVPLQLSILDGLAKIEPAGGKLYKLLLGMSRTLEGK